MYQITAMTPQEEVDPPRYSDPGHALFVARAASPVHVEVEELDHREDPGCVHWMTEGAGLGYWVNEHSIPEGVWVLEDVTGQFTPANVSMAWEADEEFDFTLRAATFEEIAFGYGGDFWESV